MPSKDQSLKSQPPISGGSRRSNHRHKKTSSEDKKKNMRQSLGSEAEGQDSRKASGSASPPSKTHLLLVQSGKNSAFLGEFLALVDFFLMQITPTFAADFWTIYGPQQYFQDPKYIAHPTIKFEDRVVASRHSIEHYEQSYTYVDPTQICKRVFQWLDIKADTTSEHGAKPGDSIIIIILAHGVIETVGNTRKPIGIRLGNNTLLVDDFVSALRKIPREIQVNVLSTACYSAVFAQAVEADQQAQRWVQSASQPGKMAFAAERSVSGRLQNSAFIGELVRSLAGLGRKNQINLGILQDKLQVATEAHSIVECRSTPFSYSDSPLATQVHTLLLRGFADFPFTPQNSAARRRKELYINMLKQPFPKTSALMDKTSFIADMIAEEHEGFSSQPISMFEEEFGEAVQSDYTRRLLAGDILRGMLVRGRLQAAVFDVYMQLCLQGVCSLSSLEYSLDWFSLPQPGTCLLWIHRMLGMFSCFRVDWHMVQVKWAIEDHSQWFDYTAPLYWLAIMIARSFTSLSTVFDVIQVTGQLGPVNADAFAQLLKEQQPSGWEADVNAGRGRSNERGSGTFACWLPEMIDPYIINLDFDTAAMTLSNHFYKHLERTEHCYAYFFDIPKEVFNADVKDDEVDVRDWVDEDLIEQTNQTSEYFWA